MDAGHYLNPRIDDRSPKQCRWARHQALARAGRRQALAHIPYEPKNAAGCSNVRDEVQ